MEGVFVNVGFPASGDSKDVMFLQVEFHLPLVHPHGEFVGVILMGFLLLGSLLVL